MLMSKPFPNLPFLVLPLALNVPSFPVLRPYPWALASSHSHISSVIKSCCLYLQNTPGTCLYLTTATGLGTSTLTSLGPLPPLCHLNVFPWQPEESVNAGRCPATLCLQPSPGSHLTQSKNQIAQNTAICLLTSLASSPVLCLAHILPAT